MKVIKCDKCCIGYEHGWDNGGYLVQEGYNGHLDDEFEFCPYCGFDLPKFADQKPKKQQQSGVDEILRKVYLPSIREQFGLNVVGGDTCKISYHRYQLPGN